jgi:hypothetical protein
MMLIKPLADFVAQAPRLHCFYNQSPYNQNPRTAGEAPALQEGWREKTL